MLGKKDDLLIIPVGGVEDIGANCNLIGTSSEWLMVDLGISFYDKCGIDILTPDITYPMQVRDKIKGIFITHAHEDHIGAIPYLWQQLKCPIYLTEFPAVILRQKLSEFDWGEEVPINVVKQNDRFKVGNFEVEFVPMSHSIVDASSIFIKHKNGSVFHTGDWKIDKAPGVGHLVDEEKLKQIGKEGVDCLMCDSTNIMNMEDSGSEEDVRKTLSELVEKNPNKRITITCFASNLARIETILSIAKRTGRKVAVIGRSMHKMIDAISKTTYYSKEFKDGLSTVVSDSEAVSMPKSKVMFLCTGSQGEFRSALFKIARDENRTIKLGKEDLVLFSSKVIPGNEIEIRKLQNLMVRKGVEIITSDIEENIHVSGHPGKESVLKMYKWIKPKTLMPVHGDASMLFAQKKFALENGIKKVYVPESGDVVAFREGSLQKIGHVDSGYFAVDGRSIIPLESHVVKDRMTLSFNGSVAVSFVINKDQEILDIADFETYGIPVDEELNERIFSIGKTSIENEINTNTKGIDNLKILIARAIRKLYERNCDKKPMVSVQIHIVEGR